MDPAAKAPSPTHIQVLLFALLVEVMDIGFTSSELFGISFGSKLAISVLAIFFGSRLGLFI